MEALFLRERGAAVRATAVVKGRSPLWGFQDFMLILDIITKSQTVIRGVKMTSRLIYRLNKYRT